MREVITYLSKHKFLNLCLATFYYLLVVIPHEQVGLFIQNNVARPLGRSNYNLLVLFIALVLCFLFVRTILKQIPNLDTALKQKILILLGLNLIFLLIALKVIIVINVELIHVVQYGLMAIFIFPLCMNYRETLFWSSLLGALDELYQYIVLTPYINDYYDFNDVILNMLGVSLGLIFIRVFNVGVGKTKRFFESPANWMIMVGSLSLLILYVSGIIGIYPADPELDSQKLFLFIKEYEAGFWHTIPVARPFHIVRPFEALVIMIILFNIFSHIGTDKAKEHG